MTPSTGTDLTVRWCASRFTRVTGLLGVLQWRWVLLVVSAAMLLAACGQQPVDVSATADYPPIIVEPAPVAPDVWQRRGEIVTESPFTDIDPALSGAARRALRATYHSTSATTGQQTNVTGAFFIPNGVPPEGGWPVIALAHGTTGAGNNCGLSSEPDLRGDAPLVAGFLAGGYAVAITDYEGLGPDGQHPYLEPRTAAFNVIDSVRALRFLDPAVSSRWLAYGVSQGGQASWAAAEFDSWYGEPLELVGAVALAPAANLVGFSELAYRRELSRDQLLIGPLVIAGLSRYDPTIVASRYLRGPSLDDLNSLVGCDSRASLDRSIEIDPADVGPTSPEDAELLTDALRRIALPQRPSSVPLFVLNGLQDRAVLPQWVSTAVARSCELGGILEHQEVADAGHSDIQSGEAVWNWIADRFSGKTAESNCP